MQVLSQADQQKRTSIGFTAEWGGGRKGALSRRVKLNLIWLTEGPLIAQSWKVFRGTRRVIALKENPELADSEMFKTYWGVCTQMQNDLGKGKHL